MGFDVKGMSSMNITLGREVPPMNSVVAGRMFGAKDGEWCNMSIIDHHDDMCAPI